MELRKKRGRRSIRKRVKRRGGIKKRVKKKNFFLSKYTVDADCGKHKLVA